MKYIDADKLLSEINARIERCEKDEEDGYPDTTSSEATLKSVRTFITSLQQEHPSLPSNIDEAAEEYSENILANGEDMFDAIADGFRAGAEWMAGQGETLNLPIDELSCGAYISCVEQGLTSDDDVIIQVRKKQ